MGEGSFNNNCQALCTKFFTDTIDNLPAIPDGWIKPALVNLCESFYPVTTDHVQAALHATALTSALGLNGIIHLILPAIHIVDPLLLPTLFTALVQFSVTPRPGKLQKLFQFASSGKVITTSRRLTARFAFSHALPKPWEKWLLPNFSMPLPLP